MSIEQEIEIFSTTVNNMIETFKKKRNDYGQITTELVSKYGALPMIIKLADKFGRIENLLLNEKDRLVKDETVRDTLIDLANYAIITIIELQKIGLEK